MSETRRLILTNSGMVDLSEYLTKAEAETLYANLDSVNNKQDKLISGTNIKSINGQSILGSGNITISGGDSSGEDEYAGNYPIYRHKTIDSSLAIRPNTFTILKYTTAYVISLYPPADNDIVNEYIFAWYSSPDGNSLSLPSSIIWANDDVLIPEDYNTYIISIIDNVAVYIKVEGNIYNVTYPGGGGSN